MKDQKDTPEQVIQKRAFGDRLLNPASSDAESTRFLGITEIT